MHSWAATVCLLLSTIIQTMRLRQRLQNMHLPRQVLARALQRATVFEIEVHAVGHLLAVLVGDVRGMELEERVAFCDDARGLLEVGVRFICRNDMGRWEE